MTVFAEIGISFKGIINRVFNVSVFVESVTKIQLVVKKDADRPLAGAFLLTQCATN